MAKTLANYDPLVQIPSGMTPAGADFPIVESHDILVGENDKRLDAKLDDIDSAIGNVGQTPIATQLSSKVNTGDIVTSVAATGSTSNNKIPSETAVRAAIEAKTINVDSTVTEGSANAVSGGAVHTQLATKQDVLTFDTTPTASSSNPVTSGGVKTVLDAKQDVLTFDTTPTASSSNPVTSGGVKTALDGKQNVLTYETTPIVGSVNPVTSTGIRNAIDTAAAQNLGAMQAAYDTFSANISARVSSLSNGMVACSNIAAKTTIGDTRILLYTGTTNSTYTNGHWYYNSAPSNAAPSWTDGGAVGSAPTIDNTLTVEGAAANSKAVGDAIENIVTISNTQPGSNSGNKVWIKETTNEEVQIPTYEEHISKANKADITTNNESDNGSGTITASKAYVIGDHFYINNTNTSSENYGVSTLYKATAAIASGDAIVVGTNCEASKVADEITSLSNDIDTVKADLDGLPVTPTGDILVSGYYIKNTGVVTASANFKTYKYDVSDADFVRVTTYGFNSTIAVVSNADYDASSLPGKTFPSSDVFIIPEGTISSIQAWTAECLTNGKSYLYISCYKNKEPTVYAYTDNGVYPRSLQNEADVSTIKTEMNSVFASYTSLLNTADKWTPFSNNANNLTPNRTFVITYSTNVSNLPYSTFAGFLSVYMAYYGNTTILMQDATRGNAKEIYRRVNWSGTWTAWNRVANDEDVKGMVHDVHELKYTADLWTVFHKVGVIGDSLASGESASNEGGTVSYHDLYPFSWGQCLARESGNTYYNFSKGGLTTKTWMTDADYGYALASQSDKICDAYIIGLGQNDSGQHMTVGTSADINLTNSDLNADTFFGNYGKIIQKMQIIAPKAPIFVISRPTVSPSNEYEAAIRAMPTIFSNVYLIDLYKYVNDFYDSNSIIRRCLRSGHYNAVAYKTISKYISQEISNVIVANLDDFLQVEFINTDWSWTS